MSNLALLNPYTSLRDYAGRRGLGTLLSGFDNSGNYLFIESLSRQFPAAINLRGDQVFDAQVDHIILPLSNMLSPTWTSDLGQTLSKTRIRPILTSIGVQADTVEEVATMQLSDDCLNLLRLALERDTIIGVRGDLSKKLISRFFPGSDERVRVIGCPSLMLIDDQFELPAADLAPAIHATHHGRWRKPIGELLAFGYTNRAAYIAQNEIPMIMLRFNLSADELRRDLGTPSELIFSEPSFAFGYYNNGQYTWNQLRDWYREHTEVFMSVSEWTRYLQDNHSLVVGSRFHGTIAGLVAGVPSLLLLSDARTLELNATHLVPSMDFNEFHADVGARSITDIFFDQLPQFRQRTCELRDLMVDFFTSNGVDGFCPTESTFVD